MQQTSRDENKRWLIYKVCLFVLILFGLHLAALFGVLMLYPHDQQAQNRVGLPFIVSCIASLIAISVMRKLHLKKHFVAESYSLPYKLRKEKFILYFFAGCAIVMSAMMIRKATSSFVPSFAPPLLVVSTNTSTLFTVPAWALGPIFICIMMALLCFLVSWQGAVLYQDHLHWYGFGSKNNISYNEIKNVTVEPRASGSAGRGCNYILKLFREHKPPLEINLTPFTASSVIIMLNVIHQYAPDAAMNELAGQMRQGDFPVIGDTNQSSVSREFTSIITWQFFSQLAKFILRIFE